MTDAIAPVVRIVSPTAGAQIDPRQALTVTVEATDAVGVTQMGLASSGSVAMSENRPVAPPSTARTERSRITFGTALPTGGTLNLNASARDAAGNTGTATGVTVQVRDVVPPTLTIVLPANAATAVDRTTAVVLTFSEPMNRATLTSSSIRLSAGAAAVPPCSRSHRTTARSR